MNASAEYAVKFELMFDEALNDLSTEDFEKLLAVVQELVELYKN